MTLGRFNFFRLLALFTALATAFWAPAQAQQSSAPLSKSQLEQLVAPIALHPDPLLSQMLMASTYPTEIVQAARWVRDNPGVSGQALEDAMQKQPWDPSVKSLAAVPQALQMMNDKLDWTQQLGDAFLGQQQDVLAAVQRLRQRAEAAGHLKSSEQQKVSRVQSPTGSNSRGGAPAPIAIEPTNPDNLYLPVYDPNVVYGDWPYPEYAPFYWYPTGYPGGGVLAFATAVAVGSALWGNLDWWRDRVDINVNRFNQFNRTNIADKTWRHNPRHRGNVPYRDARAAQRFGDAGRAAARESYRGKADAGRRDLAKTKVGEAGGAAKAKAAAKGKMAQAGGAAKSAAKGKASQGGAGAKAKSAAAGRAKDVGAKSAARKQPGHARAASNAGHARHASRPRATAQRPQMRGYGPARAAHRPALRGGGGGHRIARGGGGFRGGGGGRRGRR